jgi:hypothetical protein
MIDKSKILKIKDFESLIEFLANELDWPIDLDKFDDLNVLGYDFSTEELGLNEHYSAKIREIKQLRPLRQDQPWTVFWLDFEPRRLPITVLRRILSKFIVKKRQNSPDRASWEMEDLLFITGQGELSQRGITFAHFHRDNDGHDVIRDFSWESNESHFNYISGYLNCLKWKDSLPKESWREEWLKAFQGSTRQAIRTSEQLAK